MFFLTTNLVIGKYYSDVLTQLLIGSICYAIAFFLLKDMIPPSNINYFFLFIILIIISDLAVWSYRRNKNPQKKIAITELPKRNNDILTPDPTDIKVKHDTTSQDMASDIFSISLTDIQSRSESNSNR